MKFLAGALVFFAGLNLVCADPGANPTNDWRIHFEKGKHEGLAGVGVFFSPVLATTGRPTENYAGPLFQLGYMLNDPGQDEWRESFEFAGELYGGGIFLGRGHYVANATLWLRYNLIPPDSRWIPYIQLGAGVTLTDADQGSFGQVFNFNEGAALGIPHHPLD